MRFLNRAAGRLSRRRRGPLAGLTVLLAGLLMTGGLYAVFSPATAQDALADDALIAEGHELFLTSCSSCHGENGEGASVARDGQWLGPPLAGVGAAAVDFQVGTGRMPMSQPGVQAVRKKVVFSDEEIEALSAYVASLGPGPAIPSPEDYSIDGLSEDERNAAIANGGQIFLTNCTACHNFNGSGGAMPRGGFAPTIRGVDEKHIYEAMLTGPQTMDVFSNGNLSPDQKRDVIAYLKSIEEQPEYGGFTLGGLGPVSEGVFAWLIGVGGCLAFAVWIAAHSTRTKRNKVEA